MDIGYIHSLETFGTVDGPGIRFVIFLQGCPMRCMYCHNPDTWEINKATPMSVTELLAIYERNKVFYKHGGITVTGGEPLVQIDFVTSLFKAAKELEIHTCLDTSGSIFNQKKLDCLLQYCDLVLLDIKHIDSEKHKIICGKGNEDILRFARYLDEKKTPTCIRHVVVPNLTDDETSLLKLGEFIGTLHNVISLDVLPYHDMGKVKYKSLNIPYPLKDTLPLSKEAADIAKKNILRGINKKGRL